MALQAMVSVERPAGTSEKNFLRSFAEARRRSRKFRKFRPMGGLNFRIHDAIKAVIRPEHDMKPGL